VEVTVTSASVDILNPTTGAFVPGTKPKQIETQIEFQIIAGGTYPPAAYFPAFSGAPWTPIMMFFTDADGHFHGTGAASSNVFYDLRNDIRDAIGDISPYIVGTYGAQHRNDVVVDDFYVVSKGGGGSWYSSNFHARVGSNRVFARFVGGAGVQEEIMQGYTRAVSTLEHMYLVPLIANGIEAYPVVIRDSNSTENDAHHTTKGIPVATNIQPIRGGHHASLEVPWLTTGLFAQFESVPAEKAVHVVSYWLDDPNKHAYYQQTSGGKHIVLQRPEYTSYDPLKFSFTDTNPSGEQVHTINLLGKIPSNAKTVMVSIEGMIGCGLTIMYINRQGCTGPSLWMYRENLDPSGSVYFSRGPFEIALNHDTASDATLAFNVIMSSISSTGVNVVNLYVNGWSL